MLASAASGELGPALAEIDQALEERSRSKRERVELLLLRAEVAGAAGMYDDAVVSLDSAHSYAGGAVLPHLMAGLEQARLGAQERANVERERELTLRIVDLRTQAGEATEASELLIAWVARAPRDVEALRLLLQLLCNAERWTAVIGVAESLLREDIPEYLGAIGERLVIAARSLGRPELARKGLERALERASDQVGLVELLGALYEELSEKQALAELMLRYLSPSDPADKRFEQLRRIGQLLLDAGDSERALAALTQAWELRPDDMVTVLFIADAQIAARRFQEAQDLLEKAMNACKSRRSPELAQLRYRMAKLSSAAGDPQARLEWLNSALEADMNNGDVASELAVVAQNMNDLDTALKALRAITMLKSDAPMTRAEAFYRQAVIVAQKGEPRRAVLWAKKAKAENANFPGVDQLLAELGEAS